MTTPKLIARLQSLTDAQLEWLGTKLVDCLTAIDAEWKRRAARDEVLSWGRRSAPISAGDAGRKDPK